MIEAIDSMMNEKLSEEITKFVEDRKALAQEKIAYKENVGKHSAKLESFMLSKLSEELKELHGDRKGVHENFKKMEEFVVGALAKEIKEFHEDKKGVVETKVKLVAEAKKQMAKMKEAFITRSAKVVENAVNTKLAEELKSLKEDITAARTVNFGKKIFEAFASEYQNSYLNEKSETAKLMKVVDETTMKLKDAEKAIEEKQAVIESKEAESKRQADLMERKEKMAEMLKPLGKDKSEVMSQLLESVSTAKLEASFNKYLPHVMADKAVTREGAKVLSESGGDRAQREDADLTNIRKLAGI
jgi:prophage DNA circulation protein